MNQPARVTASRRKAAFLLPSPPPIPSGRHRKEPPTCFTNSSEEKPGACLLVGSRSSQVVSSLVLWGKPGVSWGLGSCYSHFFAEPPYCFRQWQLRSCYFTVALPVRKGYHSPHPYHRLIVFCLCLFHSSHPIWSQSYHGPVEGPFLLQFFFFFPIAYKLSREQCAF